MKTIKADSRFRFSSDAAAKIAEVKPRALRLMVEHGTITPAVRGSRGGSRSHQFTAQCVLGIAVAAGLIWSKRGCSQEYAKAVVDHWSGITDDVLRQMVGLTDDWWASEQAAVWAGAAPRWTEIEALPDDNEQQEQVIRRFLRAVVAIREKMGVKSDGSPRVTEPQRT
jgi:hypothetical protein